MTDWQLAPLNIVCSLVTDGTHHSPENTVSGDYKYVTAKNIRPWGLDVSHITYVDAATHAEIYARCPAEYGDVLYIKDGVTTGLAVLNTLREPISLLSSVALLKPNKDVLRSDFLKHWLNSPLTKRTMTEGMTGTAIKRLVLKQIRSAEIPVAPLAEQKRIADKLDTVLTRVDAVNTRLARVAPLLKRFRQSVLAAAYTCDILGIEHGKRTSIAAAKVKDISIRVSVGHVGVTSEFYTDQSAGIPFVRSQNVKPGNLKLGDGLAHITQEFHNNLKKSQLQAGDLLVVRVGANRGDTCMVPLDLVKPMNCANIVFARPNAELVNPTFLSLSMQSPQVQQLMLEASVGGAQGVINTSVVGSIPILLPSLNEQIEIVRRVETLFAFADRLEARLAQAQTAATRLTPALLAKAFRGELVPQDPNDEPAAELLRRLAQAPAASPRKGRKAAGVAA